MSAPKLLPALLGGLFLGVLSALPIVSAANACCCLWIVLGGVLAAWVMQQNHPQPVTLGDGALVGLMAGLIGFVVTLAVSIPISYMTGAFQQMSDGMLLPREGMTPEVRDLLSRISPAVLIALGAIVMFVVSLIFSTIGGLIGAALFRRRLPPAPPGPIPPSSWGSSSPVDLPPSAWREGSSPSSVAPPPVLPPLPPAEPAGDAEVRPDPDRPVSGDPDPGTGQR
jgi:hypothetical protein